MPESKINYDEMDEKIMASPFCDRCKPDAPDMFKKKGASNAADTHHWMINNEEGFWDLYKIVKQLQQDGRMAYINEFVIVRSIENRLKVADEQYIFPISEFAGIKRYMVMIDPSLIDNPIKKIASFIDYFGLYEVDYLTPYIDKDVA